MAEAGEILTSLREANLGHMRTREGMAKARAKGRLEGKQPKLPLTARKTIHRRYHDPDDDASLADLAEEYSVGRSIQDRKPDIAAGQAIVVVFRASSTGIPTPPSLFLYVE